MEIYSFQSGILLFTSHNYANKCKLPGHTAEKVVDSGTVNKLSKVTKVGNDKAELK